ncbi:hypothetical protein PR003_g2585 [Phytophthora rubi]|uniref:Uncharacterized protein n=1 Tax=Phytophthora rubi TaxID=129364 RepID=A0A6A4G872_9STRA|nr:hypothetical protein PR003_g2585 [Phytophthora rubi]
MPRTVAAGALAFLGPPQVPGLTAFHYVRVSRLDGAQAIVTLIDPDGVDDDFDEPIDTEVIRRRLVEDAESTLWPGSYVGSPVAFVQPDGVTMDTRAYGVVTGYTMHADGPHLHLRQGDTARKIALIHPLNVRKVDWIDYVLQVESGTNTAALNTDELGDKLAAIRALCATSRTGLAAKAAHELTVAFVPTDQVPVIKPDTLQVVSVPRQHVLDCALKRKAKKGVSMYVAPQSTTRSKAMKRKAASNNNEGPARARFKHSLELSSNESDDEPPDQFAAGDVDLEEDKQAVQRQNRSFTSASAGITLPSVDTSGELRSHRATTFRPTPIERSVHDAIGHPSHTGKEPQFILEYEQQARENTVDAPPVLRAAYDFSFDVRGLSVMHFARVTRAMRLADPDASVNMVDFSRKNIIRPAAHTPSYMELMDALMNLRHFGIGFYNDDTASVLQAAVQFMTSLAEGGEPDRETTRRLVLWINSKLGRFRGIILSSGLADALHVKDEFHISDRLLCELLQDQQKAVLEQQKAEIAALSARVSALSGVKPQGGASGRASWSQKQKTYPKSKFDSVMEVLPKKGSLELCMKYLSKNGCTGVEVLTSAYPRSERISGRKC